MSIIQGGAKTGASRGFYPRVINGSLRFNDDDSAYLSWTPVQTGDSQKKFTLSFWIKRANIEESQIFSIGSSTSNRIFLRFDSSHFLDFLCSSGGSTIGRYTTSRVFRDPSSWYHIVVSVDTSLANANSIRIYINGEEDSGSPSTNFNNQSTVFGTQIIHAIGSESWSLGSTILDGYLAEFHCVDNAQLGSDAFGEFKENVWVAKAPSVDYGTNGFYLDFANSADIGNDVSGEGNDWTPNNFTASDVVLDSPTDNFCTWNPLQQSSNLVLSDGNLVVNNSTTESNHRLCVATHGMTSGKYYWEIYVNNSANVDMVGIVGQSANMATHVGGSGFAIGYNTSSGNYYQASGWSNDGTAPPTGFPASGTIGVAFDADAKKIYFHLDGNYLNSADPVAGTGANGSYSGSETTFFPAISIYNNTGKWTANFGQQDFTYTPPSGYVALSTANLPDPAIDPAQGSSPVDYFGVDIYAGTSATHERSALQFQPDFVWTKHRNGGSDHQLVDAVRGNTKALRANTADTEDTFTNGILSFDSDGVTLGSNSRYNGTSGTYVSWNWNAGGSTTSGTATGNGGSRAYSYRANQDAGFSIVTWTGDGTDAGQVPHGLTDSVDAAFVRARNNGVDWHCFFKSGLLTGEGYFLSLNKTDGEGTTSYGRADLNDSSTQLTLHAGGNGLRNVNNSGTTYVAYVFKSVEGFSKIGSYSGNNSTDGPFIYLGFRPAMFMVKCKNTAGSWYCYDTARLNYNVMGSQGQPIAWNTEVGEDTGADASWYVDALSNGIKIRNNSGFDNGTNSFIYMAFAENPFKYSLSR